MCTITVYVDAEGRRSFSARPTLCHRSRHSHPCSTLIEVEQRLRIPPPAPAAPVHAAARPPRPSSRESISTRYSISSRHSNGSRPSTHDHHPTGSRRSSTSSSSHRGGRDRSPRLYINGQRVSMPSSSDAAPAPRTPPQSHAVPRAGGSPRESHTTRPRAAADERTPRYVPPPSPTVSTASSRHSRQTSTSSRGSTRYSYTSVEEAADEEAAAAAAEAAEERAHVARRDARKDREMSERIRRANSEIASRDSYGRAPSRQVVAATTTAERRSRRDEFDEPLGAAMGRLTVEDRSWREGRDAHRRSAQQERQEREEQTRRLREAGVYRYD